MVSEIAKRLMSKYPGSHAVGAVVTGGLSISEAIDFVVDIKETASTTDIIADARNTDPKSISAWRKNQDMRHYDKMAEKHGEDNVRLCEICWRGVHKAKAKELKSTGDKAYIGPICWKRHKNALKDIVK